MKKIFLLLLLCFCVSMLSGASPKYVFLFIGDGMATPQRMVAEEFSRKIGRGNLVINHMPYHATTRTNSASSIVTDSAAAATAIACGVKTDNGRIGLDPAKRKLESVAYVAQKNGKKVGIVTSVTINHATPAGFYAHRPSRSQYYAIGLDLINSGFDYFGGGGVAKHDDKSSPEYKGSIYKLAAEAGYKVISTRKDLLALKPGCGKVLARGAEGSLPGNIDIDKETTPTLADFTAKGIELLYNPKGFFMMVEGGAIDAFGHANEAAGNLQDVLAFDDAVRVAMKFAEKHPAETLIIVTGDHETGGMTMGFAGTGYAMYVERLAHQKCSVGSFRRKLSVLRREKKLTWEKAQEMLTADFGFKFSGDIKKDPMVLTGKEIKALKDGFKAGKLAQAARIVMSGKAGIGWTTGSHTALPVLTTSQGAGAEIFSGFIDNTDIAKKLKTLL